jgi:phosphoadenosine phosphosulfate reductase
VIPQCYEAARQNGSMSSTPVSAVNTPPSPLATIDQAKVATALARLRAAVKDYGRVVYSSSLGAEAMVLTDLIWTEVPEIEIFTLDTGRLPEQTYDLIERLERRYQRRIRVYYPDPTAIEAYVAQHGINGFYNGVEQRQSCCAIRKIEPFRRAVHGAGAWVTGVRHEQSAARGAAQPTEFDSANGLAKISPILEWTHDEVWAYIRSKNLPYNPLHDQGYPSIGCAPCTRAVEPGEDSRSGRWWWENTNSKECGLHPKARAGTSS